MCDWRAVRAACRHDPSLAEFDVPDDDRQHAVDAIGVDLAVAAALTTTAFAGQRLGEVDDLLPRRLGCELAAHAETLALPRCVPPSSQERPGLSRLGNSHRWVGWWVEESISEQKADFWCFSSRRMADGVGFEPTVGVNPRRFSRPVP